MKKDRNCTNTPYPVYQVPMMPMMPNTLYQGSIPVMQAQNYQSTSIEQQISNLNNQMSNLERRITNLENLVGSNMNTNYNTSNFQMM